MLKKKTECVVKTHDRSETFVLLLGTNYFGRQSQLTDIKL
jgi:hypothetical protein